MKILSVYQKLNGHGWEMGFQLSKAFKRLGHEVIEYGFGHNNYDPFASLAAISLHNKNVDLVVHTETNSGQDFYRVGHPTCPTAIWLIDTHCVGVEVHRNYASQYDFSFHATRNFIPYFGANAFWLPNAADPEIYHKTDLSFGEKPMRADQVKADIGFCGSVIGDRKPWIEFIQQQCCDMELNFKVDEGIVREDMLKAISYYNVHWNKSIANDINARVFETTAIGTALITNNVDGLGDLFGSDEILTYNTRQGLAYLLRNLLTTDLISIAKKGHTRCCRDHTYVNRAKSIIEMVFGV